VARAQLAALAGMSTPQVLATGDALEVVQAVLLAARVSIVQHFGIGSGSRT
jgi:hypothetical protein